MAEKYAVWAVADDGYVAVAPWSQIGSEAPWHFAGYEYLGSVSADSAEGAREEWAAQQTATQ